MRSNADDVLASRRLGIYLDDVYWVFEEPGRSRISTDRSFLLFLCEVGERFDRLTLFGRTVHGDAPSDYVLPPEVELVELPHYANLRRIFAVLGAAGGSLSRFWRGLDRVDTLWIFGPHPFAVAFVVLGAVRRKRIFLGVRQDSVKVYQARLPGLRWAPAILVVRMLDGIYRLFARKLPTTVQGAELAASYRGSRTNVLTATESVVRAIDLAPRSPGRDWSGEVELLTVGRLEPEKNPLLLVEALARLERERPSRYRLTWVGRGPLDDEVRQRASELGVLDRIEFHGYVPFDGGLLDLYRRAHMFVHVSLSEGMPKVLIEALACATPIVATDVGGVRSALADGSVGLLVPADDLDALVEAILRISEDPQLREGLVARGLELVTDLTLEAEVERVASFLARHLTTPTAADAGRA